MARPSAWPWAGPEPAVADGIADEALPQGGALSIGHHAQLDAHVADAGQGAHRRRHPVRDLRAHRAALDGEGDLHLHDAPRRDADVVDHVQLDDAAVQFGVVDPVESLEDLLVRGHLGGGHREPPTSPPAPSTPVTAGYRCTAVIRGRAIHVTARASPLNIAVRVGPPVAVGGSPGVIDPDFDPRRPHVLGRLQYRAPASVGAGQVAGIGGEVLSVGRVGVVESRIAVCASGRPAE